MFPNNGASLNLVLMGAIYVDVTRLMGSRPPSAPSHEADCIDGANL